MLHHLTIRHLALLKEAKLDFSPGFTALTGETGAGKSVVLRALSFLAGSKADKALLNAEGTPCEVEGVFFFQDSSRLDRALEAGGLPPCEDGMLIIRRSFSHDKGSRCWVNGSATTASKLLALGELWIDFHSPEDPQKLLSEGHQLDMLDAFSTHTDLKATYKDAFTSWQTLLRERQALEKQGLVSENEYQLLEEELAKFESLPLNPEAIQDLEQDFKKQAQAQTIQELCHSTSQSLQTAIHHLRQGLRHTQELGRLDLAEGHTLEERLRSALLEADDMQRDYQLLGNSISWDKATIEAIHHKMQTWLELKRKYGPSLETVLAKKQALAERLASQGNFEARLYELEGKILAAEQSVLALGEALTQKRKAAALNLGKSVQQLLSRLGFKKGQFSIDIVAETTPKAHGTSSCQMLFSANPGQAVLPLNRIASSGEMARVMLALKALLAQVDSTPLLVFDEVDANVGGEIGLEVARELRRLAQKHQVLCVTHLPQVAAFANSHWLVEKAQDEASTHVSLQALEGHPTLRLQELARMLGDRNAQTALHHAQALLQETAALGY